MMNKTYRLVSRVDDTQNYNCEMNEHIWIKNIYVDLQHVILVLTRKHIVFRWTIHDCVPNVRLKSDRRKFPAIEPMYLLLWT